MCISKLKTNKVVLKRIRQKYKCKILVPIGLKLKSYKRNTVKPTAVSLQWS